MFSRFPKWLFRAFLAFVALELFYLLAVTIALNTGLVERIVNRKPEKYQVHWDWAWSPWPGRTYLGGVETKGQTKKFQWYAAVDSVSTTYRILPLFDKTVHLTGVRVKGVDYRQRRRLIPGAPPDPTDAEDPPIPGYSNPPDPPPESLYPKKIPKPPWTIQIDRVEAQLMQIWVDRYRITGGAECETAMKLVVREHLELPMVKLRSSTAELWVGDEPRFQSVKLDIDVKIYPFVPKGTKGLELLRKISGRISIKTPDSGFAFVESHFRKVPWLEIDGRGPLLMTLNLDRGKFLPGTSFEIDRDHIDVKFLDRHLVGNGFIDGEISLEEGIPRSRVTVVMDEFHMTQVGASEP
ncbi:MAG: hypothetical protein V3T54_04315, partial [Acidobacteriota bacterium]